MSYPASSAVASPSEPIAPIARRELTAVFAPREADTNKGSFGAVGILGGGPGMTGAALLAARAALKLGAGKVFIGFPTDVLPFPCDMLHPELMLRDARGLLSAKVVTTWVAGCGLGETDTAVALLETLMASVNDTPLVLDADGLNLLAANRVQLPRSTHTVLTPHPAEAGRLLGSDAQAVQHDRPAAARALVAKFGTWIVLKGANTLIASPGGDLRINQTGNPGLATGGTGDTLAGMMGALIAQGIPMGEAVMGAVWLHGAAADLLASRGIGPTGMTAGELPDAARELRNGARRS